MLQTKKQVSHIISNFAFDNTLAHGFENHIRILFQIALFLS